MIVVAGLITRGETALMTFRHDHEGKLRPNMWEYPGGKLEFREPEHVGLKRELHEELGLKPEDITIRDHIGSVELHVEVNFTWSLWHVEIPLDAEPQPLEAQKLMWVRPEFAIKYLPCTPTTYLIYQPVRGFMEHLAKSLCVKSP